jgi:hypothetical protein
MLAKTPVHHYSGNNVSEPRDTERTYAVRLDMDRNPDS